MPLTSPRFAGNARLQSAAENKPPLKIGEPKGQAVELLQQALADLGYQMPISFREGKPDGIYGKETTRVVRQFQIDQGFSPDGWDGRAGRDTLTRLDQLFPPPRPLPPAPPPPPPPIPPRRGQHPARAHPARQGEAPVLRAQRGPDCRAQVGRRLRPGPVRGAGQPPPRRAGRDRHLQLQVQGRHQHQGAVAGLEADLDRPGRSSPTWRGSSRASSASGARNTGSRPSGRRRPSRTSACSSRCDGGEDLSVFRHSHWNLHITKVDSGVTSNVDDGGGLITNGDANLDSQDLLPEDKGGPAPMVPAIHEFGHMIGYRDEYVGKGGAAADNPHHTADLGSIMNRSITVRERHYVLLADWLTRQSDPGVLWRVNGVTDVTNAKI